MAININGNFHLVNLIKTLKLDIIIVLILVVMEQDIILLK